MDSLMKLKMYGESESEEEESLEERLPLPCFLENSTNRKQLVQEVNEEGKIRNFPHEPGNWATYVYIPVDSFEFSSYLNALQNSFKPLNLKIVEDFHISLTKTVVLRHHWIPDFIASIKKSLREINSFRIRLFGLKAYVNEQSTRSFLSLKVSEGEELLNSVANQLGHCFREYNLQGFYEKPSFHLSLLWCPGDRFSEINRCIDLLPLKLKNFDLYKNVTNCICAIGNKQFTFEFYL